MKDSSVRSTLFTGVMPKIVGVRNEILVYHIVFQLIMRIMSILEKKKSAPEKSRMSKRVTKLSIMPPGIL